MKERKKQPMLTRQAILDAAGIEFARNGYAGTGIGSIVAAAGLTKGAVFHHFADKQAMAVAWIRDVLAPAIEQDWVRPLERLDSLSGLKAFCRAKCLEMRVGEPLCTLVSFGAGVSASHSGLADELHGVLERVGSAFSGLLNAGKSSLWIHRSIQPPVESRFLVGMFCGFAVTARLKDDEAARSVLAAALEAYLDTLRPE